MDRDGDLGQTLFILLLFMFGHGLQVRDNGVNLKHYLLPLNKINKIRFPNIFQPPFIVIEIVWKILPQII